MLGLLFLEGIASCGESEEDLRSVIGSSLEVSKRKDLNLNADRRKVMELGGREGELICEISMNGRQMEQTVGNGRKIKGGIRYPVNAMSLIRYDGILAPFLM